MLNKGFKCPECWEKLCEIKFISDSVSCYHLVIIDYYKIKKWDTCSLIDIDGGRMTVAQAKE